MDTNPSGVPEEAYGKLTEEQPAAAAPDEADEETEVQPEPTPEAPAKEAPAEEPPADEDELSEVEKAVTKALENIEARRPKPEAPKPADKPAAEAPPADDDAPYITPTIKRFLDSDDAAINEIGKALLEDRKELLTRIGETEARVESREQAEVTAQVTAEITDVAARYTLSDEQVQFVVAKMVENPALAKELTFEQGVRAFLPDAALAKPNGNSPQPTPKAPAPAAKPKAAAATIVTRGAAVGATPTPWQPGEKDTVESAVNKGYDAIFGRG